MANEKYALITGASKGIGKAIAWELAGRGHNLLLTARSGALLKSLAEELRKEFDVKVECFEADLTDPKVPGKLFEWCESNGYEVDILVNNAGFGIWNRFEDAHLKTLEDMCQLNMMAVLRMAHLFLPMLKRQEKAWLLNVGSMGAYQPLPTMATYGANKSFVLSFTRAIRDELRKTNVSVTVLNPGGVQTEFAKRAGTERVENSQSSFMMSAEKCARITVKGMFAGKKVIVPGWYNRIGVWLVKHMPRSMAVAATRRIFEKAEDGSRKWA